MLAKTLSAPRADGFKIPEIIMRMLLIFIGLLMTLIGGIWLFQGIGVLLGSFMTGQSFWAYAGGATLLIGLVVLLMGLRRKSSTARS